MSKKLLSSNPIFKKNKRLKLDQLEQRVLYDAELVFDLVSSSVDSSLEKSDIKTAENDLEITALVDNLSTSNEINDKIVFIDSNVLNKEAFISAAESYSKVIVLSNDKNPWEQISQEISQSENIKEIHLVSHGSTDGIILNNKTYNINNISEYSNYLDSIKSNIAAGADFLIYGCNIGSNSQVEEFTSLLKEHTGLDVALSTNDTGDTENADYKFEFSNGTIEAKAFIPLNFGGKLTNTSDGFGDSDFNGDGISDPLRMITWNVIGVDSNKPESSGPDTFMIGLRVNTDNQAMTNYTVKIVDDDGKDIFGNGIIFADSTTPTSDFDDGVDNIQFINKTMYTGVNIDANSHKDFYFNVNIQRLLDSLGQMQAFHFEVFKDDDGDGVFDPTESGQSLTKFSWLPDAAAANTPLYLYVEKLISQARNDVTNQTYPTEGTASNDYSAIRIDGYTTNGIYPPGPVTIFVGQELNIRVESQTATQGYPQLTVSTLFQTNVFNVNSTQQAYDQTSAVDSYQQGLGSGYESDGNFETIGTNPGDDPNSSIYANSAGWNPATHSLMITSAPPKAGGGPIVTDYKATVTGTGAGKLETLILDYSGSSFHYNADLDNGVAGIDFVTYQAVKGTIVGQVLADTDGDGVGDTPLAGVSITLNGILDTNLNGSIDIGENTHIAQRVVTTNANGYYIFTDLLPGSYTVVEGAVTGYGDVNDTDGGLNKNQVNVTIGTDVLVSSVGSLGLTGMTAYNSPIGTEVLSAEQLLGYQRADFVEGRPDLSLTKIVDNKTPAPGGQITYTLTVINNGSAEAPYIEVIDKLPPGVTFNSASGHGSYDDITGLWTISGGLAKGGLATINIVCTVNSSDAITNFAQISAIKDTAGGNNILDQDSTAGNNNGLDGLLGTDDDGTRTPFEDDEAKVTVEAQEADLSLIKTYSNVTNFGDRPSLGDILEFKIIVTNTGPNDATNVVMTDRLPAALTSINLISAPIGSSFDINTGMWNIPTIANGEFVTLIYQGTVSSVAEFSNFAQITSADQYDPDSIHGDDVDSSDNQDDEAQVTITPHASDLSLSKVVNNLAPDIGENITYTLILNNNGPDAATNVVVKDLLPPGLTFVSATGTGSYDDITGLWNVGAVGVGDTVTINIVATVTSSDTISNFAQIYSSDLPDPDSTANNDLDNTANEDDESSITITPGATDLSLSKSYVVDDGVMSGLGEVLTFTLTVTNTGSKDAYHVRVKDLLDPGFTYQSTVAGGTGTYTAATGIWNIGTVEAGTTKTISFKVTNNTYLEKQNYAEIIEADAALTDTAGDNISTLSDIDSTFNNDAGSKTANEDDEALIKVAPIPYADLQLTNVISKVNPVENENITFTLKVTNTGFTNTSGVQVSYVFPQNTGASGQFADPSSFVFSDGTDTNSYSSTTGAGTWTIGNLAYGETATLTITVKTPTGAGGDKFTSDLSLFAQISASSVPDIDSTVANNRGADNTLGTSDDGTNARTYEDDEAIATAISPASTRLDVALTESISITRSGTPISNATALQSGDQVTFIVTGVNQGGDANSAYIMVKWDSKLDLSTVTMASSTATNQTTVEYSTDANGTTWSGTKPTNPTYVRFKLDTSSSATKFDSGSTATLTFVGTVNASGVGQNATLTSWWADIGSGSDVDSDSSVTGVITGAASNDTATDDLSDGVIDDDEAKLTIGGNQSSDLSITKSISTDGAQTWYQTAKMYQNDVATIRITITNSGPDVATNVTVDNVLPAGMVYKNYYGYGSYSSGTWNVGTLAVGQTVSAYVLVTADWSATALTSLSSKSEVITVDQPDSDSTKNNTNISEDDYGSITITKDVLNKADLSLTKTINNNSPQYGDNVTFTLTVNNAGPANATGVVVKDLLPPGLTFVSASGTGSYDNVTGLWTVGSTINNGSSASIQIVAKVETIAAGVNFAQIYASDLIDPDSTINNDLDGTDNEDDEAKSRFAPVSSDLSLSKIVNNATPNVGDTVTFTLSLVNAGPSVATGVQVKDLIDTNILGSLNISSPTGDNIYDVNTGIWNIGTVQVGEVVKLQISGTLLSAASFYNFAEVIASDNTDPDSIKNNDNGDNTVNEDDESKVLVRPQANDLELYKSMKNLTDPSGPLDVNDTVEFTLTLINAGGVAATNVQVTDYLPSSAFLDTITIISSEKDGVPFGSFDQNTGLWDLSSGSISEGSIVVLKYTGVIKNPDVFNNFAEITSTDQYDVDSVKNNDGGSQTADEDDEARVTVDARSADLSIMKSVSKSNPQFGETVTFTLDVYNSSSDDATGVEVKDYLTNSFAFVTGSASLGGSYFDMVATDEVVWSNLTVPANSKVSLTFRAVVVSTNISNNTAEITNSDLYDPDSNTNDRQGDDFDSLSLDPQAADLSLSKTVSVSDLTQARIDGYYTATYTLTLTNDGPDAANLVQVKDGLPKGLSFISSNPSIGTYNANTGIWEIPTIANGETLTLTITTKVLLAGSLTNQAEVISSDTVDPDSTPKDNTGDDYDSTTVDVELIDLSLEKTVSPSVPTLGGPITYTLTLTNRSGFDDASGVQIRDYLPSGFSFDSATPSVGTFDNTTGIWDVGSVLAGQTVTLSISGTVLSLSNLVNIAEVINANQLDVDSTPNDQKEGADDYAKAAPAGLSLITGRVLDDIFGSVGGDFDVKDKVIPNVTVKIFNVGDDPLTATAVAETTTDVNGVYSFYLPAGNYFIYQVDSNSYNSIASLQSIDPNSGVLSLDKTDPGFNTKTLNVVASTEYYENNFLDVTPLTVSGTVFFDKDRDLAPLGDADDVGFSGAKVALYKSTSAGVDGVWGTDDDNYVKQGSTLSVNPDGTYSFNNLLSGVYKIVQTVPSGYSAVDDSDGSSNGYNTINMVLTGATGNVTNADFLDILPPGSIAGRVVLDANDDGVPFLDVDDVPINNVTIKLFNQGDNPLTATPVAITTTDTNGDFVFNGIAPGNYFIYEINPTGKLSVTDSDTINDDRISFTLNANENLNGIGFVDKLAPNAPPEIQIVDENAGATGDETVVEDSTISNREFTLISVNPIEKITIAGTDIVYAALLDSSNVNVSVNTTEGVITITGYNSTTGVVSYTYNPNGTNKDHSGAEIVDSISLVITDNIGLTGSGTLDILINDTAPTAYPDSEIIEEDAVTNTVSGSVFTGVGADDTGADTPITVVGVSPGNTSSYLNDNTTVGNSINGTYGSIVINADGSYTYTLNNSDPAVQALNTGDTLTDTFTYSIIDSDGSTSFTTIEITINGADEPVLEINIPDNNGLDNGNETVQENEIITNKTFTITSNNLIDKINIDGTDIVYADLLNSDTVNININTTEGVIVIIGYDPLTQTVTYNYNPNGTSKDHSGGEIIDSISLSVTDVLNNTIGGTLDILITDTVPLAVADSNTITEDENTISESVFNGVGADDTGADIPIGVVGVVAGDSGVYLNDNTTVGNSVDGIYGSIVINSDGSYTYTLNRASVQNLNLGDTVLDTFTYSIIDSDGSTSFTTIDITINGVADNIGINIPNGNGAANGNESVSENSSLSGKTFSLSGNNSISKITIDGTDIVYTDLLNSGTANISINTTEGIMRITGYDPLTKTVTYSYDPSGLNKNHSGGEVIDSISLEVTDEFNFTASGTLDILITDTVPTAINDINNITEESVSVSSSVFVGLGTDLTGSDTPISVVGVEKGNTNVFLDEAVTVGSSIGGTYGSIVINSDGSYTYTLDNTNQNVQGLNEGETLSDTFTYSIVDSDGSVSYATLTITINGANEPYADLVTLKELHSENKDYKKGDLVQFRITVENIGNTNTTGVSLTENIPTGLSLVSATTNDGVFVGNVWDIGSLSINQKATLILTFEVTVDQNTSIVNTVSAATSDLADPSNSGNDLEEAINIKQNIINVPQEPKATPPFVGRIENETKELPKINENVYFDPSLHVTNAVKDAREEATGVTFIKNRELSSATSLDNWDPALYVLPAVNNVEAEVAVLSGRISEYHSNISSQIEIKDQSSPLRSGLVKALEVESKSLKELEIKSEENNEMKSDVKTNTKEINDDLSENKIIEEFTRKVGNFNNQINQLRDLT